MLSPGGRDQTRGVVPVNRPPGGAVFGAGGTVGFGGEAVAVRAAVAGDRAVGHEEPSSVPLILSAVRVD